MQRIIISLVALGLASALHAGDRTSERDVLVALYESTDGANWKNNSKWMSDRPTGEWYGVTTHDGRVTRLVLPNNRLSGELPSSLGNLAKLQILGLSGNALSGSIPTSLGGLSKLRVVNLSRNAFSGPLPASLSNLTNLAVLLLENTQLCAPRDPGFQTWLGNVEEGMGVVDCRDRDMLVALYEATDGANWMNNTNWLSDRPTGEWYGVTTDVSGRVTHLDLRENRLSGTLPSSLGNLTKLQDLTLYRNEISGELPSSLGNLAELQVLWLGRNRFEGSLPSRLWDLTGLKLLFLGYNRFSGELPPSLGNLVLLEQLWVGHNQFSGKLPSSMVNLTSLQRLGMPNTQLCAPTDAAFQTWLRGIEIRQGVVNCATDRDILVALYDATDGPNWKNNTNWLSDRPTGRMVRCDDRRQRTGHSSRSSREPSIG